MADLIVNSNTTISGTLAYDNITINAGKILQFAAGTTTTVTITVNQSTTGLVLVYGTLRMHPNAGIEHTLTFSGTNPELFQPGLGTAMFSSLNVPPHTEAGLWVLDAGDLDIIGQTKQGWNRTGTHATWVAGDSYIAAPWGAFNQSTNPNGYTAMPWTYGTPLLTEVGPDGVTYVQEVFNLTRNVHIQGTDTGLSHIYILSSQPQTINYAEIKFMGPESLVRNDLVLGRYPIHFHHNEGGSIGTTITGTVVRNSNNRGIVPHNSDGITMTDTICYKVRDGNFWYDHETGQSQGHFPGQLTYDHCAAVGFGPQHEKNEPAWFLGSVVLNGENELKNCVATGGSTNAISAAFLWSSDANGAAQAVWNFHDNIAHNIGDPNKGARPASRVWQNLGSQHFVDRFVAFHCSTELGESAGVVHGAYHNNYKYTDCVFWDCSVGFFAADGFTPFQIGSYGVQQWTRCIFEDTIEGVHNLPPNEKTFMLDCTWLGNFYLREERGGNWVWVVNSNLEPADVIPLSRGPGRPGYWPDGYLHPADGAPAHSVYMFQRSNNTAFKLNNLTGAMEVTPQFYFTSGVSGSGAFTAAAASFSGAGTATTAAVGHVQGAKAALAAVGYSEVNVEAEFIPVAGSAPFRVRGVRGYSRLRGRARMRGNAGPRVRRAMRVRSVRRGPDRLRSALSVTSLRGGQAAEAITATGAFVAAAASFAGLGATGDITGIGTFAAAAASFAGTGSETLTGAGAPTFAAASFAGVGEETAVSVGNVTAAAASLAGTGNMSATGAGSFVGTAASFAGTGEQVVPTGVGDFAAAAASFAGEGTNILVTGTGDLAAAAASFAGTGIFIPEDEVNGIGDVTVAPASFAGIGDVSVSGTGDLAAAAASFAGTAAEEITGTGDLAAAAASFAGVAEFTTADGTAEFFAAAARLDGLGIVASVATGDFIAAPASFGGQGQVGGNFDYDFKGPYPKWRMKMKTRV